MTQNKQQSLRRYTDLPALLHILTTRKITLLDPAGWDDQNDSFYLSQYKEKMELKSVLALCFSQTTETYHHWRVFSHGSAGVCIEFERDPLVARLDREPGVTTGAVSYITLQKHKNTQLAVRDLPFAKRYPYKPESEFRALYASGAESRSAIDIGIELNWIRRITLSPWLPEALAKSVIDWSCPCTSGHADTARLMTLQSV